MKKCLSACLCSLHCSNWKTLICFRNWFVIKKQGSNSRTVSLWPCFLRNLSSTSMNAEHSGVSGRFRARSVSSFQAQEPFQVYLLIQIKPIAGFFLGSHFLVTERILRRIHGDNRGMQSRVKTGHGFADQLTPLVRHRQHPQTRAHEDSLLSRAEFSRSIITSVVSCDANPSTHLVDASVSVSVI